MSPAELRTGSLGHRNHRCQPPEPVSTFAVRSAPCAFSSSASDRSPAGPSTSSTTKPDAGPVTIPTFALGQRRHHSATTDTSLEAFVSPP